MFWRDVWKLEPLFTNDDFHYIVRPASSPHREDILMEMSQLFSLLADARENHDIYLIARAALMLKGHDHDIALTDEERAEIIQCLEDARNRNGILGLEDGYELARWILICRHLFPEKGIKATSSDIIMIQEACDSYIDDRILKQVASLVHMRKELDIPVSINRLPPKKRKYVLKLAATLE